MPARQAPGSVSGRAHVQNNRIKFVFRLVVFRGLPVCLNVCLRRPRRMKSRLRKSLLIQEINEKTSINVAVVSWTIKIQANRDDIFRTNVPRGMSVAETTKPNVEMNECTEAITRNHRHLPRYRSLCACIQ